MMRSLLMKLSLYAAAVDLTAAAATPSNVDLRVFDTLLNKQNQTLPRLQLGHSLVSSLKPPSRQRTRPPTLSYSLRYEVLCHPYGRLRKRGRLAPPVLAPARVSWGVDGVILPDGSDLDSGHLTHSGVV